jgi:hypothetical protein
MQGGRRGERTVVRDPRQPTEDPEMRRFAASWTHVVYSALIRTYS